MMSKEEIESIGFAEVENEHSVSYELDLNGGGYLWLVLYLHIWTDDNYYLGIINRSEHLSKDKQNEFSTLFRWVQLKDISELKFWLSRIKEERIMMAIHNKMIKL